MSSEGKQGGEEGVGEGLIDQMMECWCVFPQIETNRASGSRVMSGKQLYRTNEREIREIEVTREQWYCFCTRIVHTNARLFSVAYESAE